MKRKFLALVLAIAACILAQGCTTTEAVIDGLRQGIKNATAPTKVGDIVGTIRTAAAALKKGEDSGMVVFMLDRTDEGSVPVICPARLKAICESARKGARVEVSGYLVGCEVESHENCIEASSVRLNK